MARNGKKLSDADKAKAAARREAFKAVVARVAAMSDAERAELSSRTCVANVDGHTLSVHNQCLIALQAPGATIVAGFRGWLAQGRCVAKGERGITIWIPTVRRAKDASGNADPEAPGERGFMTATVFDIGQTVELEQPINAA